MRAVVIDRWLSPEQVQVREIPEPQLRPETLLVEVRAAGCNFYDTLIVEGKYQLRPSFPFTLGGELAGVVREVGSQVNGFHPGDRVLAALPYGAFAERVLVPASAAHVFPEAMSFEEAACFPIAYGTAYLALAHRAHLATGETLLVHAAAGGAGLAAVQIGAALGARVIGTAGGREKCTVVLRAGADLAVDYREEDFVEKVKGATENRGADIIFDSVGGEIFDRSLKCLAWEGRLLVIGFAGGRIPELRANRVLLKNIAVIGLNWGSYAERAPARVTETFAALFALYERGALRPLISARYPLEKVGEALDALRGRLSVGKLVVTP